MTDRKMTDRKLWRIPEEGRIKGVCAGIAEYLGVPVRLIRILAVLSLFIGLFMFTVISYLILAWVLDPRPPEKNSAGRFSDSGTVLSDVRASLQRDEQRLRQIERYVTSDTFTVQQRFRQL